MSPVNMQLECQFFRSTPILSYQPLLTHSEKEAPCRGKNYPDRQIPPSHKAANARQAHVFTNIFMSEKTGPAFANELATQK